MHPLRPGDPEQIGEYAILGRLDEGPRGDVYVGKETGDDAPVRVIKLLAAEPGSGQAVLDRLTVATRVSSSYVARTITAGLLGDRPYVVREHVEGRSLAAVVAAEGPLSGEALERVAVGVLTALTAVHLADLAHGSLAPHNVIVADDGVKLTDVAVGPPVGEPAYRAPEQIRGERYDAYADMFAWAATVVFAATGRPPFPQEPQAVLNAPPDLGGLEERLRQVVLPALAKEPGQRPTAYTAMLQLLGGGAAGAQPAPGPGATVVLPPAQPSQPPVGGIPVPPGPQQASVPQQTWGPPPVPQQPQQASGASWQPPAMPQEQPQQQTWGPPTTQGKVETVKRRPFPVGLAAAVGAVVLLSGVGLWGAGHYSQVQLSPAAAERAAGQHGNGGRVLADGGNANGGDTGGGTTGGGTTGGGTGGGGQAPTAAPQVTVPWALSSEDPDSPVQPLVLPSEWPTDAPVTPELTSVPTPGPIVPVPTQPVVPPPAQPPGQTTQPTARVTTTATVTAPPSPVPTQPTPEPPPTQSPSPAATDRQEQVPSPQPTESSEEPTGKPTEKPTDKPVERPSWVPSWVPTERPARRHTRRPTEEPTASAQPSTPAAKPTTATPAPSTPVAKPTTVAPKPTPKPTTVAPKPTPKPTTVAPKPTTVAPKPTPKPTTAAPVRNPYSPVQVCGAGFSVQRSSALAGGTTYQLYNPGTGENCVVTIKTADVGKATPVSATLEVQGGGSRTDSGNYEYYAGPVKLQAKGKCVKYSGSVGSSGASAGWANCG
ncbi:protein kinase [Microbispora rosea]|uniref:serine/threonine protein kinase n=1 Tax=Microbispora rosea TaxID=58117 RepID=UPI003690E6C1